MLGTWRYILAVLVALSHDGLRIQGLNPGVMAVVGFYLISGEPGGHCAIDVRVRAGARLLPGGRVEP